MRILITGATGFVGSHVRRYFLTHTDWAITGTSYPDTPPAPFDPQREALHYLDLRDAEATHTLLAQAPPDYVIHLAAQSHVPTSYQDPWGTLENNIRGQLILLEAFKALSVCAAHAGHRSGEE